MKHYLGVSTITDFDIYEKKIILYFISLDNQTITKTLKFKSSDLCNSFVDLLQTQNFVCIELDSKGYVNYAN